MDKNFTFVLKNKGTSNEGWWLKVSNADELLDYYELDRKYNNVISNYLSNNHQSALTQCISNYSAQYGYTFIQGIVGFQQMVATQQLESIHQYGCIYINRYGGYHGKYKDDIEYEEIIRNSLTFPQKDDKQIKLNHKVESVEYGFISPNGEFYDLT